MNLFVLDLVPRIAAQMHNDKHVVKMVLETAQLLCTAHYMNGDYELIEEYKNLHPLGPMMYKPTHTRHPCTKWVHRRAANYRWAYALFCALCDEYTHRYDKVHLTDSKLRLKLLQLPLHLHEDAHEQSYDVTGFALAMPDKYKNFDSAVTSYRDYYMGEKRHLAQWTNRDMPEWWQ